MLNKRVLYNYLLNMTSLFKKRQPKHVSAAFCSVSEVEQHLADSEFNIGKIQEIQNKFAGGEVGALFEVYTNQITCM